MKRLLFAVLFALLIMINMTSQTLAESAIAPLCVVATGFPGYDFVRQITGGCVDLIMLLPPGSESHSFEPTPQDVIRIGQCDMFVTIGGESDAWIDRLLDSMDGGPGMIVKLMDCVTPVEEALVEGMEEEPEDHEEEVAYDEHVWTSPQNARLIVARLTDALCALDAPNADAYRANAAEYDRQLQALDRAFEDVVEAGNRRVLVFGDRFPFRYLADAYGLEYYAAFPGCSTETEPSAQTVRFLIDKVRAEGIPVVFHVELSNEKMADTICEETGAQKRLLHACHNISIADFDVGATYLSLMTENVAALKEALK